MEIGKVRLAHVRFQYYENKNVKNCPKHYQVNYSNPNPNPITL